MESIAGVETRYGELQTREGYALQTMLTLPAARAANARLPAVHFVQWLSCDTVALSDDPGGWTQMLKGLVGGGAYAVSRLEKAGVGESGGPACSELDYETELAHHDQAIAALKRNPAIDPNRIVIFGASMGATMAPLLANRHEVAGVAAWGGGAHTWFERTLAFERNAAELSGDPKRIAAIKPKLRFLNAYLIEQQTPAEISRQDPQLGALWGELIGTEGQLHYGRPVAFHQQAQRQDWLGAWANVDAPVLILFGEYDWFETRRAHESIRRVNPKAELHVFPQLDHHFERYETPRAAFAGKGGRPDAKVVLDVLIPWLNQRFSTK